MKVSMPTGSTYGWGIAGTYIQNEIAKLASVPDVVLHSVGGNSFQPFNENDRGNINIGYCFFEEEIPVYHQLPEVMKQWDFMVAGSRWCEYHLRIGGMERTTTILQGVDHNIFYQRPLLEDESKFIVFSGGKFEFRKGQDIVIAAMKIFMEHHNDVWLATSWYNPWVESIRTMEQSRFINFEYSELPCVELYDHILERNGVDLKRVIQYPLLVNEVMADAYANSHIGLFPNRCEGGNNMVMCEYMACGRTVIASNRTGHADVITDDNAFSLSKYEPVIVRNNDVASGVWFEADVAEVVELLEHAYKKRKILESKAKIAASDMQKLSWSKTAQKFHSLAIQLVETKLKLSIVTKTTSEQIEEANELFHDGKLESSETMYRTLLVKAPFSAELHNCLATVLDAQQRYMEAIPHYTKALALQPCFTIARFNLANTLKRSGNNSGCRENLMAVVEADPAFLQGWQNLSSLYFEEGKLEDAAFCLEKVISISPERILAWAELGDIYHRMGDADQQALSCFEQVIVNKPDFAAAYNSKGLILHEQYDFQGAEKCYRAALALEPDVNYFFMNNLALVLYAQSKTDEAIQWFNNSLKLEPDSATTHFNRGTTMLAIGDYKNGWADYEYRFEKVDPVYLPPTSIPRWNGECLLHKAIIVRMEQGYGDCIQCLRFLPKLHETGATIIIECIDDRIKSLCSNLEIVNLLFLRGEPLPAADFQVPFFSLPHIFGTDISTIPFPDGYIKANNTLSTIWKKRMEASLIPDSLKVGLVWGGRKTRQNANRSLDLHDLSPLFDIDEISWYSLQVGDDLAQLLPYGHLIENLGEGFITFADTAAAIVNLDMVITIDTSVAHLSGGLGVPTWVLLKAVPDWRWMLHGNSSPWYQSMVLFRQAEPGKWESVVKEIKIKLSAMMSQKKLKSVVNHPIRFTYTMK